MLLCCDFLSLRLALTGATEFEGDWYHKRRAEWVPALDPVLLMALDGCRAYLRALLGLPEELPGWLAGDSLEGANLLRPARPMFEVILNQVLLARGEYAKVLGRLPQCLAQCSTYPYALGTLHLLLQQAGAYDALGKGNEAYEALRQAAELAAPDRFWMPFVENTPHLKNLVPHLPAQWRGEIQGHLCLAPPPPPPSGTFGRAVGDGVSDLSGHCRATIQPGDRPGPVPQRGDREAICQSDLHQAPPDRGRQRQTAAAGGAGQPEKLTRGYYLSKTSHRTLSLYGGMFLSRPIGKKRKEEPM